jgi:hypothetical protein
VFFTLFELQARVSGVRALGGLLGMAPNASVPTDTGRLGRAMDNLLAALSSRASPKVRVRRERVSLPFVTEDQRAHIYNRF